MMLEKRERVSVELREHRAANQSQTSVSPTHRPKFLTQIQGMREFFFGNYKKTWQSAFLRLALESMSRD